MCSNSPGNVRDGHVRKDNRAGVWLGNQRESECYPVDFQSHGLSQWGDEEDPHRFPLHWVTLLHQPRGGESHVQYYRVDSGQAWLFFEEDSEYPNHHQYLLIVCYSQKWNN